MFISSSHQVMKKMDIITTVTYITNNNLGYTKYQVLTGLKNTRPTS